MTGFSDYEAKNALNRVTGHIPAVAATAVFLALFTAAGSDAGSGFTEVSGGSYARVQVAGRVTTNGTTSTGQAVVNHASVPAWVVAGMAAYDVTTGQPIGTVQSTTGTTVTLTGNAANAVGNGDSIAYSAFGDAGSSAPSTASNGAVIGFPAATADWGSVIAWGLYDASSSGNLLFWDYLGNFPWLPATVSSASPGVITAKAHGYSNGDAFVFSTEYGGAAPSFSAGNYTGLKTVAGAATDSFNVTGVNTSATGSGMVRKVTQQSIPNGIAASFGAAAFTLVLS